MQGLTPLLAIHTMGSPRIAPETGEAGTSEAFRMAGRAPTWRGVCGKEGGVTG